MQSWKHTIAASYIGYITQAIINNFAPMLFLIFHTGYGISLDRIGLLITINFGTQMLIDFLSAKFTDKIGYRILIVAAHICAAAGLILLAVLPVYCADPFTGLCAASVIYAIGGGLIEVLISPIVEAVPGDEKSAAMSMLHSFYCWGTVLVIALSTAAFAVFGTEKWRIISCLWAIVPAANAIYFTRVPIARLTEDGEGMTIAQLIKTGVFRIFIIFMICAGASELAMSQWASAFAEQGLGIPKAVGDLAGPCFFAILMGTSRMLYAKIASHVSLTKYMFVCAVLCACSYFAAALSGFPAVSLIACSVCGFSVGVMWPGTFSIAAKRCPSGGTAMFAILALAGDIGCSAGPALVGAVSARCGDDLRMGLLCAAIFPLILAIAAARQMSVKKN